MPTISRPLLAWLAAAMLLAAAPARAGDPTQSFTADGDPSEWGNLTGFRAENWGHMVRAEGRDQLVWYDRATDERTDFANPDPQLDLTEFRVSATATTFFALARFTGLTQASGDGATQIQIAVAGGGSTAATTGFFMGNAETNIADDAHWHHLIQTRFGSNTGLAVYTGDGVATVQPGGGVLSVDNDVIELGVSWASLGFPDGPPDEPLRLTVAVFRANASDGTFDTGDTGLSDVMDAVTNYGTPGALLNTWDDVMDGTLGHAFDVYFDSAGRAYGALKVNEVDYDTPGTDDAEFIEIANAAPVAVALTEYELLLMDGEGGGAVIDDAFVFPEESVAAAGYYVVCANPDHTPHCDLDVAPDTGLIENGPDAVALILRGIVQDTVSYGGNTGAPFTESSGSAGDSSAQATGMSRFPDRTDSFANSSNFSLRCASPGLANLAGTTGCTLCGNDDIEMDVEGRAEACDEGLENGQAGSCCSASCTFFGAETVCRPVLDEHECDVEESCTGDSPSCPADEFLVSEVVCRDIGGVCDVSENCTGEGPDCPPDAFVEEGQSCRGSAGTCDVVEECTGESADCPADGFADDETVCRPGNECDAAELCPGDGAQCPEDVLADEGVVCRAATGDCDVAETCDGETASCPTDEVRDEGETCRASAGLCDVAEACDGEDADCPGDAFAADTVECRAATGDCDLAELCTGSGAACPDNAFAAATVECRAAAGVCDLAETCTGSGADCPANAFAAGTVECRAGGECDPAELCTGSGADCPGDVVEEAGSPCGDQGVDCHLDDACDDAGNCVDGGLEDSGASCSDGAFCNGEEVCGSDGVCSTADEPCGDGESCNEVDDECAPVAPDCGDGVIGGEEECDDGEDNSDTEPDACREDCTLPFCGDGVIDSAESCDDAENNSDTEPDACRTNCALPTCGNGTVDEGEQCDDGESNSNTDADACRETCVEPFCGDFVIDTNEDCDEGGEISNTCSEACQVPRCGNGTVDENEACDDGEDNGDADPAVCSTSCTIRDGDDAGLGDVLPADAGDAGDTAPDEGCCAVAPGRAGSSAVWLGLGALALLATRRRLRR